MPSKLQETARIEQIAIKKDNNAQEKLRLLKSHYKSLINVPYEAYKAILPHSFDEFKSWRKDKTKRRNERYLIERQKAKDILRQKYGLEL